MLRGSFRTGLIVLAIVSFAPVTLAVAKSPPKGTYTCQQDAYPYDTFAGTLKILSDNRYRVNGGRIGKFAMSGQLITWETGVYKGVWRSKVRRADGADRTLTIGHFFFNDRQYEDEEVACYRDD